MGRHVEKFLEFSWVWGFVVAFAKVEVVLGCAWWVLAGLRKGSLRLRFAGYWAASPWTRPNALFMN